MTELGALHITVDRGNPVIFDVAFGDGDPDAGVFFAYTRPGDERPRVDDGFGQPASRIERLAVGVYRYTLSTKDFEAGVGHLHLWGEWLEETLERPYRDAHQRGTYRVRQSPMQLL